MIYLLIIVFAFFGVFGHDFRPDASEKLWRKIFWIFTSAVIICVSCRKHLGIDFVVYDSRVINSLSLPDLFSSGTRLFRNRLDILFMIIKPLSDPWRSLALQSVFSLLLTIPFSCFLLRNTRYWFSCYILFFITVFFPLEFEVIFQGAAVGIFLWAYRDLKHNRLWTYLIKVLVAAYFHFSAISMMLLPLLLRKNISSKIISYRIFPFLAVAVCAGSLILPFITPVFDSIADLFPVGSYIGFFFRRVVYNLSENISTIVSSYNWKGWIGHIVTFMIFPTAIFYILRKYTSDTRFMTLVALSALLSIGSVTLEVCLRLNYYLLPFFYVAIMEICPQQSDRMFELHIPGLGPITSTAMRRCVWLVLLSPMIFFNINKFRAPMKYHKDLCGFNAYYPYLNWIQNQDTHERDSIAGTFYDLRFEQNPETTRFHQKLMNEKIK